YLVSGRRVNAFTNEEEAAAGLDGVVPFLLEDGLRKRGAIYEKSAPWQKHIAIDGRLVTGQNPASAHAVGEAVLQQLRVLQTE
ncbi:MAG TPA: type 1 glutamine amidotransferase domain-containing protein, partial [Lentimicrobium sp.]|nr:type 1 glutamine amidotransferase domain-containing protein [Lentimicrobium sp.]